MSGVEKRICEERIDLFRYQVLGFLGDVAPGSEDSLTIGGMPNPFLGTICRRFVGACKLAYNLIKYKALWRNEKVFKPVIDAEMVHPDGTKKKFVDLGRNLHGELVVSCAVTTTDLGFGRSVGPCLTTAQQTGKAISSVHIFLLNMHW